MKIKQAQAVSLLDEWIADEKIGEIAANEITAEEYAKKIGRSYSTARMLLRSRVEAGTWTRRKVNIGGKAGWAYKPLHKPR